ncbi:MAG: hypothetical protein Fur0032_10110 [Terrimicrobiaceae bacterium]
MYLATVLIEPNRWSPERGPAFSWCEDTGQGFAEAGFSGVELWQGHWLHSSKKQKQWMRQSPCPVRIFSYYGLPEDRPDGLLVEVAEYFSDSLTGIKFNLGSQEADFSIECNRVACWAAALPGKARLLCECHGGTTMQTPEAARAAFAGWPPRIEAILHPFVGGSAALWFDALGTRITHLHLQCREQGAWVDPQPSLAAVQQGLQILRERQFSGTASLEFIAAIREEHHPKALLAEAARVRAAWSGQGTAWGDLP